MDEWKSKSCFLFHICKMSISIRSATPNDIEAIRHIAHLTWPVAYTGIISPEQIGYMLQRMYDADTLRQQFNNGFEFFLALQEEEPIGFASASVTEEDSVWKLHKLYVLPYLQKTGAGKALIQQVTNTALAHGASALLLNVNKYNNAYQFYLKQGFSILKETVLDIGQGFVMDDYIMHKAL